MQLFSAEDTIFLNKQMTNRSNFDDFRTKLQKFKKNV